MKDKKIQAYQELFAAVHASDELRAAVSRIPEGNRENTDGSFRASKPSVKRMMSICITAACVFAVSFLVYASVSGLWEELYMGFRKSLVVEQQTPMALYDPVTDETFPQEADLYWYRMMLEYGKVYQFEIIPDETEGYTTRFVKDFSPEELQDARFSWDGKWITIDGTLYRSIMSFSYDDSEGDRQMLELEREKPTLYHFGGEDFRILRIYEAENWQLAPEYMAHDYLQFVREEIVLPLSEGKASIYHYLDGTWVRDLTREECRTAQISSNGKIVLLSEDAFYIDYELDDRGHVNELILFSVDEYNNRKDVLLGDQQHPLVLHRDLGQTVYEVYPGIAIGQQTGPYGEDAGQIYLPDLPETYEVSFYSVEEWLEQDDG